MFDYSPETGELVWKRREVKSRADLGFNNKCADKIAGTVSGGRDDNKYIHVGIDGSYFQAHRIVWKLMTGEDPPEFVDHRDGDNLNNRWKNLRAADNGTNLQNAKLRSDNKTGVKGVFWESSRKKYRAVISIGKQHKRLGRFNTIAEARQAIEAEREKLHGEFARHS